MSGLIKTKSQMSLEYKLVQAGGAASVAANTLKAKAAQRGQDIITPLVMQAATEIYNRISVKK